MLITGGLLAVGVLAIIGVVLLSIERKSAPEPQTVAMASRATIPLQQAEELDRVHGDVPLPPVVGNEMAEDEGLSTVSEEEIPSVPGANEQLYEIVKQLQQLQHRVETLERHLDMQNIVSDSFNRYEDQDESMLRSVPVSVHNDNHQ